MTYGYLGEGGGMDSCPHCGGLVPGGSWHTCPSLSKPPDLATIEKLERIATALEQIASFELDRRL